MGSYIDIRACAMGSAHAGKKGELNVSEVIRFWWRSVEVRQRCLNTNVDVGNLMRFCSPERFSEMCKCQQSLTVHVICLNTVVIGTALEKKALTA